MASPAAPPRASQLQGVLEFLREHGFAEAEASLRTEMEARMDTLAEDESNDGDHGAMSPSSGNEDPSSPRSTPSHTKVGTSPRGTPMDVTKLAAVIDEIEADMLDDDADAVNARAEDEDPDGEETPPDDDRLDRDSAKTRSPDAHKKDEDDDDEDEETRRESIKLSNKCVPAPNHPHLHGDEDPTAHAAMLARWQVDDVDVYDLHDAGYDVLPIDRREEDRFISSELVGGERDDDSLHADTRVGWWQPKVGEETIEADARPWRDDLGKEGTQGGYADSRPRDSAQDWKADDRTGVDSPANSDVSSTGWVTERKGESTPTPQGVPPPKTCVPTGVFDAVSGWNADFNVGVDLTVTAVTAGDGSAAHVVTTLHAPADSPGPPDAPPTEFAFDKSPTLSVNGGGGTEMRGGVNVNAGAGVNASGVVASSRVDGSATPASECADGPALGWGGSEFGGSATPRSDLSGGVGGESTLGGAADALRAWADSNEAAAGEEVVSRRELDAEVETKVESIHARDSLDASWADGNVSDEHEDVVDADSDRGRGNEVGFPTDDERREDETYLTFSLPIVHRLHRTGFEEEKDFPVRIGDIVAGRYELTEYLGSAAFSKAVQAVDLDTGDVVCLKIVKNNKDYFDQSLDEIKLLRYINDEDPTDAFGVLRLHDYFYHREHLFIVTELLRANLYEFQRYNLESGEAPYFTLPALKKISRQLLTSLEYLHSLDLIHCDLKPENILIKSYSRCEVKVIDFGSSCYVTDHLSSYVQSRSYRAPEVIIGAAYDQKVDLWSLGCVLAELYSGEVLLHNDSLASLLARCVGIFGPFDPRLLRRGRYAANYFTKSGLVYERDETSEELRLMRPKKTTLARRLGLDPEVDEAECGSDGFVGFLLGLLAVNPDERLSATQALEHPWLADVNHSCESCESSDGGGDGVGSGVVEGEGDVAARGEDTGGKGGYTDGGISPDVMPVETKEKTKVIEEVEPMTVETRL